MAITIFAVSGIVEQQADADQGTFVDSVKFIQYLDENTALEEVRNGNLDIYYFRIPAERLESSQSREGLQVFDSTGGSYSILVNPAMTKEQFNPFSDKEIRFMLNYIVDRGLIVNELMGGYGTPIISYYGPSDPGYLFVIEQLEAFGFKYNPGFAEITISQRLEELGASKIDDTWYMDGTPIEITLFIRSDDHVRKSIGEILASELERIGFVVKRDFGDLNKAFAIVYGSDPADLKWHLYTEGWARSAFVRYDSSGLAQMYSPWLSNMPGFNDPSYWNYQNPKIDEITQRIYTGDFESATERTGLIQEAITEGVQESVRVFLASKTDRYVAGNNISGIINDFGAGVPTRFTPINARITTEDKEEGGELTIGVKQIYQGAWNPVMGFRDAYSRQIADILFDPGTFKHPFTGETIPIRSNWQVTTAGPSGVLDVPRDTITWNPLLQQWEPIPYNTNATSVVTFDFVFGNWHHGQPMDIHDVLHSVYFMSEWGTQIDETDNTFDTEFTPMASQALETFVGVRIIDEDTIEMYVDYWHFDDGEIAQWAAPSVSVPWEITSAMEQAVTNGKVSFSRSGAASKNINWLSLLVPNDAHLLKTYLEDLRDFDYTPTPLTGYGTHSSNDNNTIWLMDAQYTKSRYESAIRWIDENNHAVIGDGPFYLESYSPESRIIRVVAFKDDSYPIQSGTWATFEHAAFPKIVKVDLDDSIKMGTPFEIVVDTTDANAIMYFITSGQGDTVSSGVATTKVSDSINEYNDDDTRKTFLVSITSEESTKLTPGANSVKIFAISDDVLRPDLYEYGFFVTLSGAPILDGVDDTTHKQKELSGDNTWGDDDDAQDLYHLLFISVITLAVAVITAFIVYRLRCQTNKLT